MGILEGMAVGVGETMQKIGLEGIAAAIQAERDARLSEIRMSEESTVRQRNKDDAAAERTRVGAYAAPIMGQATPEATAIANSGGANDPNAPDEQYSSDVQKVSRAPLPREMQQRAQASGDLKSAESFGKDADRQEDNQRDADRRKSEDAKWHVQAAHNDKALQETIRHNKEMESRQGDKLTPAAKAQLSKAELDLRAAHSDHRDAEKELEKLSGNAMTTTEALTAAKNKVAATVEARNAMSKRYDELGIAHFGPDWKTAETTAAPKVDAGPIEIRYKGTTPYKMGPDGKPVPATAEDVARAAKKPAAQTGGGEKPAAPIVPAAAAVDKNELVSIEPGGTTLLGRKQFIETYADGTKKVTSGDDAERTYILRK